MHRVIVVIEKANRNYSTYSPDLPGCIATGDTREQAEQNMHEAVRMQVEGLLEACPEQSRGDDLPVPESQAFAEYIAV